MLQNGNRKFWTLSFGNCIEFFIFCFLFLETNISFHFSFEEISFFHYFILWLIKTQVKLLLLLLIIILCAFYSVRLIHFQVSFIQLFSAFSNIEYIMFAIEYIGIVLYLVMKRSDISYSINFRKRIFSSSFNFYLFEKSFHLHQNYMIELCFASIKQTEAFSLFIKLFLFMFHTAQSVDQLK